MKNTHNNSLVPHVNIITIIKNKNYGFNASLINFPFHQIEIPEEEFLSSTSFFLSVAIRIEFEKKSLERYNLSFGFHNLNRCERKFVFFFSLLIYSLLFFLLQRN